MGAAHDSRMRAGKERARIARHLLGGSASFEPSANPVCLLLRSAEGETISAARAELKRMVQEQLLRRDGDVFSLTKAGTALARRTQARHDPFRVQHAELETRQLRAGKTMVEALVNTGESPLSKLAQRRNRNGEPFLSPRESRAGERLRSDYTRGQIMPGLGPNWGSIVPGRKQGRGHHGVSEITDAALAARQRVEQALDAAGPELSGVLVDVCCFLKGLETIESERGWPVRSAKVVLKTALAVLARHYEPERHTTKGPQILHWGAEDYRPSVAR